MEKEKEIEEIERKMKELKERKKELKKNMTSEKTQKKKERRMKPNNNCGANTLIRVSNNFADKLDIINEKREENGLNRISNPKATELIIRHKIGWQYIEKDLIFFDTHMREERELYARQ